MINNSQRQMYNNWSLNLSEARLFPEQPPPYSENSSTDV